MEEVAHVCLSSVRLDLSDHQRLQTLVSMSAAELASSMSGSGHVIAMTHAARGLVPSADLRETLGGISQVNTKIYQLPVNQGWF